MGVGKKEIRIRGAHPQGLRIRRDEAGVPHITANSQPDALWGSGYAHAIDRRTQLLMMRMLGQGRLCELLADTDESLAIDRFFRRANWHNNTAAQVEMLDDASRALCQAYCDGINAGLAARSVTAMRLLGYQPEPWTIADTILVSRMASYLTLVQSQAEIERLFIELVQAGVSSERLAELFPVTPEQIDLDLISKLKLQERIVPREVLWNIALPRMMASNNWVVSGRRTQSGAAIMANDPHLEVTRLPNVWCEQSLRWGERYLCGMSMPGLPTIMVGRSNDIAWGATYTFMDTVDSWVEDCRDGQYRRDGAWHPFNIRRETIRRRKHADEQLDFFENEHGVLEGDPDTAGFYLATRWIGAESGARSIMASLGMADAKNAREAQACLGPVESGWNWVIADRDGNIAYQMSGLMPKRPAHWGGFTPVAGWDSGNDWLGTEDWQDLPCSYNPPEGFIVTANQDLNHLGRVAPINMPMGNYRATRIAEVLAAGDRHDVASMQQLQMDVYSKQAKLFLDILLPLLEARNEDSPAFRMLKNWDCRYDPDSTGAPVFEAFYAALRVEVFGAGQNGMGPEVLRHLIRETGVFVDFYQNFDRVLLGETSAWYDGQSRDRTWLTAFDQIRVTPGTRWQDVNSAPFLNLLFQGRLPAFLGFDTPPIAIRGGRATPHQGQLYRSAGRATSFCPSVRLVAEMNEAVLHTCLAGGPSDNRFSPWYTSELDDWVQGRFKVLDPNLYPGS